MQRFGVGRAVGRRLWGRFALAPVLALSALIFASTAAAQTPSSVKIATAALISPSAAEAYYAGASGAAPSAPIDYADTPAEVIELARALKNDPDLIYDYVRNNIEIAWTYGLQKGSRGAIIDRSGTAFDQAKLMVDLLKQAGYSAAYQPGRITLTGQQFYDWSGITDATAACQLLASGGIPAQINGTTNASCSYGGSSVSTITLSHIWVRVNIGAATYVFDPSYKAHTFVAGLNPTSAMGLSSGQALSAATGGMTSGANSGVNYVRNLNAEALNGVIETYGANMAAAIQTSAPAGDMEEVVGGGRITPYTTPSGGLRQTSLPYASATGTVWPNAIPNQYRTMLRVQIAKDQPNSPAPPSNVLVTRIDKTFYVDQIYGLKLMILPNFPQGVESSVQDTTIGLVLRDEVTNKQTTYGGTVAGQPLTISGEPALLRNGTVTLTALHPYAASNPGSSVAGDYMDATTVKSAFLLLPLTIVNGWGDVGEGFSETWGARADLPIPPIPETGRDEASAPYYRGSSGAARREQIAAGFLVQASRASRLHAQLAHSVYTQHHVLGLVSADASVSGIGVGSTNVRYYSVTHSFDRVDVDTAFSLTSKTANTADRRAAVLAIAATSAALEASVVGQIADMPDTSSTATRFAWGNRPPASEDLDPAAVAGANSYGPRRFYDFTAANVGQAFNLALVEGLTTSSHADTEYHLDREPPILSAEYGARRLALSNAVTTYAQSGFDVVASEEAFLGPGQRGGAFRIIDAGHETGVNDPSKQRGGAFVATRYEGSEPVEIAHVLVDSNGVSKGGGGGVQVDHKVRYDPAVAADILKSRFVNRSTAVGVDLARGGVTYVAPAQIVNGNGEFPYKLNAQLIWRGGDYAPDDYGPQSHVQPQTPWTTNWNNTLNVSSSAMEAMGTTDARAAAGTIAAFAVQQDIYRSAISPQREVAAVLAGAWWTRQISGNVVSVAVGSDTQQFVRKIMPTGSTPQWFAPGPGAYAQLFQTGARVPFQELCGKTTYATTRGWDASNVHFIVQRANGDNQYFNPWTNNYAVSANNSCGRVHGFRLDDWAFPQGVGVHIDYLSPMGADLSPVVSPLDRINSVTNSLGRAIHFEYDGSGLLSAVTNGLSGADLRRMSVERDTFAITAVTDPAGSNTRFTFSITDVFHLDAVYDADDGTTPSLAYTYDAFNRVKTARDAVALQTATRGAYEFFLADRYRGERVDPLGNSYVVNFDEDRRPIRFTDELKRVTTATYDGRGRLKENLFPEGDKEAFEYDDRNNTTLLRKVAKPGSAQAGQAIEIHATWDSSWNKIASLTDPRGYTTDFTYYAYGGNGPSQMATAVRPDPNGQGRPTYSFTYNGFGQLATSTDPMGRVTANSYGGSHSDLTSTTVDPSDVNAVTSFTYDSLGQLIATDGPRSDVADITNYTYDARGGKVFEIAPDPDGAGPQQRVAVKTTYDVLGRAIETAKGMTTSATGADFTAILKTTYKYDQLGNKLRETVLNGVATPALKVTDMSYDALNRPACTAIRMDIAGAGAEPAPACTPTNASTSDADRISRNLYDAAGQLWKIQRALGTNDAQDYATYEYTPNGQQRAITDAIGNRTSLFYDGFDRLVQQQFPLTTTENPRGLHASNPDDFEAYGYDASGNKISYRPRDGYTITYQYDALNRLIFKDVRNPFNRPNIADVTYTYDKSGLLTAASYPTPGKSVTFQYDGAGRKTHETSYGWDVITQYDKAGNRQRIYWPDAFSVSYDYDAANRLTAIWDPEAQALSLSYAANAANQGQVFAVGQPTGMTRQNGAATAYAYDGAGRLNGLAHTLVGSPSPDTAWSYNPASQIASYSQATSAYVWTGQPTGATAITYDGLNRDSRFVTLDGYDAKGNLKNNGMRTFLYDDENRLIDAYGGIEIGVAYDPLGRLRATSVPGQSQAMTFFLYDGDELIAEYTNNLANGGGALRPIRRYVHAPGVDDPMVWYDREPGSDNYWDRKFWFHADRQGSIVAVTDSSGGLATTASSSPMLYTYGPYGEPQDWQGSRFRYTGQVAFAEGQLYHYKARAYDPALGRFLQTDPIGADDDLNLYAYVAGDPVNRGDPDGTESANFAVTGLSPIRGGEGFASALLDATPGIGDAKSVAEAVANPTAITVAAAIISVLPGGDAAKPALKDAERVSQRAAAREAKRQAGIPTSQQPRSQTSGRAPDGTKVGRQQTYDTPKAGGGTREKSVQVSRDRVGSHAGQSQVEAGNVKPSGQTDSAGRPRIENERKVRVDFDKR